MAESPPLRNPPKTPLEAPPEILPVFPLTGVLLLPGMVLPLHIFEPRYRAMVADALAGGGHIGMVQPFVPRQDNRPAPGAEPDTPELYLPDTSSLLQHRLGCRQVPTYDLGGSGCAGFVQALDIARTRIQASPKKVLVVGAELITRLISWKDRDTAILFGDGAGAAVLGPGEGKARLLDVVAGTDGSRASILALRTGGTRHPFTAETAASGDHQHLEMDGRAIFKEAVIRMSTAVKDVLEKVGKTVADVALVVPHQANKRIIDAVRRRLGVDESRVYVNVQNYGNTGSASVPFALWEAHQTGRIEAGDLVVLTAFGAGFHWAAAAVQF